MTVRTDIQCGKSRPLRYWIDDRNHNDLIIGINEKLTLHNKFYETIINEWNKLKILKEPTDNIIKIQYIWSNIYIAINKYIIKINHWKNQGVILIKDLLMKKEIFLINQKQKNYRRTR